MFTNAVILILEEVIEASLLISVLLALNFSFAKIWHWNRAPGVTWVYLSILFGTAGAWIYASYTPQVSEWFDYIGQEIVNAGILSASMLWLFLLAYASSKNIRQPLFVETRYSITALCMISMVFLGIVREGYEIILYLDGVARQPENLAAVLIGGAIGSGIGISCGIFLYYSLMSLEVRWTLRLSLILLALVAGNLAAQIVQMLTQADWLPFSEIAWDSSSLLSENSVAGHLLFALVGYEATPSVLQLVCYFLAMTVVIVSPLNRLAWSLPKAKLSSQSIATVGKVDL